MNLETQATLFNASPPKLIATILKALREQLKENDQLNAVEEIAGPVPEIPLEYEEILKEEEEDSGMMSTVDICPKILCWQHDVKRLNGCIAMESMILFRCKSVSIQDRNCSIRSGWTQKSLLTSLTRKFDRDCAQENTKRRFKAKVNEH